MCGLAGFIDFSGKFLTPKQRADFPKISASLLSRRGPDAFGEANFEIDSSLIHLAHTRLSIIDLDDNANQPFFSDSRQICLVYNGEIYNYVELRKSLKTTRTFRTKSDTEVLLRMYEHFGLELFSQLEGMFAGAILDKEKKLLHLFRDHIGIKPLYFHQNENGIIFASEPKVIRSVIKKTNAYNAKQYATFLTFCLSDYSEETFFRGIHQLVPGQYLTVDLARRTFKKTSYFDPYQIASNPKERSPTEYRDLFKDVVHRQLRSDVQVGTSLSGGIDSSCIAACIGETNPIQAKNIKAITYVAPGFENDESAMAQKIANASGLAWMSVGFDESEFITDLDDMLTYMEDPVTSLSIFAQFNVMKAAKSQGCKVMLDGQGGDELYIGYPRLARRIILEHMKRGAIPSALREWNLAVKRQSMPKLRPLLETLYFNSFTIAKTKKMKALSKYVDHEFLGRFDRPAVKDFYQPKNMLIKQVDEFHKYTLPRLLKWADRNSMFHSIESRVPHLSQVNVEFALTLPLSSKVKNGWPKYIVRKAFEGKLPDDIIWQKRKIGFDTPQGKWLTRIKPYLIDGLDDCGGIFRVEMIKRDLEIARKAQKHSLFSVISAMLAMKKIRSL